jgi:hypothetical protein
MGISQSVVACPALTEFPLRKNLFTTVQDWARIKSALFDARLAMKVILST